MIISSGFRLVTRPVLIGWSAFLTRERGSRGARTGNTSGVPCFVIVLAVLLTQRTELHGFKNDEVSWMRHIRCY